MLKASVYVILDDCLVRTLIRQLVVLKYLFEDLLVGSHVPADRTALHHVVQQVVLRLPRRFLGGTIS